MVSKEDLEKWIVETLSKPNAIFNNLPPCPYAKKAWLDGKVLICNDNWKTLDFPLLLKGTYDLYIIPLENNINTKEFDDLVIEIRKYVGNEYIVLDDHPENKEEVENFKLNFGKCPLIFVQARKKLSEAREWLETKGYYKNWKNDYKEDVTKL